MRNRLTRQCVVVLGVLLLASVCHAGQLRIELYGISDVFENPGVAILGTLLAIDATKGTVRLMVKQVWVAPGHAPTLQVPHERVEPDGHSVTTFTAVDLAPGKSIELPRAQSDAPAASAEVVQLLLEAPLKEPEPVTAPDKDVQAASAVGQLAAVAMAKPDPRLAPELARLDFTPLPCSARTSIANAPVPLAVALAAHDPATIPILKPALERLLASDSGTENMTTQKGEDGSEFSVGIVQAVESMMNSDDFNNYKVRFRGARR
jgi:hypothetical protein